MRLLLILLLTTNAILLQAQQITGVAKDEKGALLNGATVSLLQASDSSTVKLAVTKSDGVFSFSGVKEDHYRVMVSYLGHKAAYSQKFSFGVSEVNVPDIILAKTSANMGNVTVTARKPLVEVKADRTILNVEGTINAVGSNALELLRKSPGVLLDKDENISLAGKNGVSFYIDGRTTPLSGQDLAMYLKTLHSNQIESIELITNPSAKYDAAGNAGIINIRLVKNKSFGTNGSVNAGWNIGITPKYNGGLSLNYRNKNINLFSNYSFSTGLNRQDIKFYRTITDSVFDQSSVITDRRKAHNYKLGADFFLNKKNTLGLMVNGIFSDPVSTSDGQTYISSSKTKTVDRILVADNKNMMRRYNANVNLNYTYTTPTNNLVVNIDKGAYRNNSDQLQANYYYNATGQVELNDVINHIISPANIDINSIKADYEYNCGKGGKLSIGIKSARVKTDNDFQRYDVYSSGEYLDKTRSNHFEYKENINAGYINMNRQYTKFMIQAGLRVENTNAKGISKGLKYDGTDYVSHTSSFPKSYTDFFPSAAITFNMNPMKQWSLTYSRRIDRPAYQDLNPFEFKLDEYTFMKGNINLRPQYTNSFGITHTYKYKLNISLNYSHVKDMFAQVFDTVETSKAFVSKQNLATQDIVNVNLSYPFQYKNYSLFTNISSNYSKYKADFGEGRKINMDAVAFNLFMQNSLKFSKTWTAELSGFYNAPTVYMGNFKGKSMYNVDAGISKQALKGRATIKAAVTDMFRTMRFSAISQFAGQTMNFTFRQESRQFKLSVNYRFGNNGVKAARQRSTGAEEELKRTQQSGGVMGN